MILKIKAFIYRHTGIYLAQKEEDAYMNLESTKQMLNTMVKICELDEDTVVGIVIGGWQCEHGFYRRFNPKDWR